MVLTKYIVIEKKNEVYLKVEALKPSIKRDLSEYFSFEMLGLNLHNIKVEFGMERLDYFSMHLVTFM